MGMADPANPKPPPLPIVRVGEDPQLPGALQRAIEKLEARLEARLNVFHEELALTRSSLTPPAPDTSQPAPPARSALVRVTGKPLQWIGALTILVGAACQLAAQLKPGLVGPLQALLDFLKGLAQ